MTRDTNGSWHNTQDQSHECNPQAPVTEAKKAATCYQNNT